MWQHHHGLKPIQAITLQTAITGIRMIWVWFQAAAAKSFINGRLKIGRQTVGPKLAIAQLPRCLQGAHSKLWQHLVVKFSHN